MFRKAVFFTVAALLATASWQTARADSEPLYWPDGSVSFRDWGLNRPGVPTLIEGPYIYYYYGHRFGSGYSYTYFPSNRRDPDAYRSPPPAGKPIPAERYYRSWGTQSDMSAPVTTPGVVAVPEGPSVIVAPEIQRHDHDAYRQRDSRHRAGRMKHDGHKRDGHKPGGHKSSGHD